MRIYRCIGLFIGITYLNHNLNLRQRFDEQENTPREDSAA